MDGFRTDIPMPEGPEIRTRNGEHVVKLRNLVDRGTHGASDVILQSKNAAIGTVKRFLLKNAQNIPNGVGFKVRKIDDVSSRVWVCNDGTGEITLRDSQ